MTTALAVRTITSWVATLALPDEGDGDWTYRTATSAWLATQRSVHTVRAYGDDIKLWTTYLDLRGLHPRDVNRGDVDVFVTTTSTRRDGRPVAKATTLRRLSVVSSWYDYLESVRLAEENPVKRVKRPKVARDVSHTRGLSDVDAGLYLRAARMMPPRDAAVLAALTVLGLRRGEAVAADAADYTWNAEHRVLRIHGKGDRFRQVPLGHGLITLFDANLAGRRLGPLFMTRSGRRVDPSYLYRLVKACARKAGIADPHTVTPHSLRHTAATLALGRGVPLHRVQDMLGHVEPRTTQRYNRARGQLADSPAYMLDDLLLGDLAA